MPDGAAQPSASPAPSAPASPTAPQPVGNAPAAAGMITPQTPSGEIEAAKLDVYHALKLLDRAIGKLGAKSDDVDVVLRARATLTKRFGEHEDISEEFSPSELKRMLASIVGPGTTGPAAAPPGPQGGAPPS